MRDVVAGMLAVLLIGVALSLATTLRRYRQTRERARAAVQALGRTIVAEVPTAGDLVLFSEDRTHFHYGQRAIEKAQLVAVRVLINGAPIAAVISAASGRTSQRTPDRDAWQARQTLATERDGITADGIDTRPEGIARDRWDVVIEALDDTLLIECGSIRERVSQELARSVFDAVKRSIEERNRST